MAEELESMKIKALLEDGKQYYPATHWNGIDNIPYAGDTDRDGNIVDGIMISDDKAKLDLLNVGDTGVIQNSIVQRAPNGKLWKITVDDTGKLGTVAYL
ncbi:hypothetical protein QOK74_07450 [Staphylococcus saprophyticus]|uniref:hypothetical protein n=1 Tax=Staphylococcus saprophyticus TaxID=29385 RepID=UPI0024C2180B|nr:hypothetical protein [Staphylococcus saprophyticus]MDK1672712.1 hypothetical protein [Staphylococcus saprophyticus]